MKTISILIPLIAAILMPFAAQAGPSTGDEIVRMRQLIATLDDMESATLGPVYFSFSRDTEMICFHIGRLNAYLDEAARDAIYMDKATTDSITAIKAEALDLSGFCRPEQVPNAIAKNDFKALESLNTHVRDEIARLQNHVNERLRNALQN